MRFARIIPALATLSLLLAACEGTPTSITPPAVPRHEEDPPPPPPPPAPADSTALGGGAKGSGG